ncbi:MAG: MATE family efflux transporter [Oscillospiraceae bacterium]|nr:MATE family efflux transporter [Oscillospiraceae bacterium]
MSTESLLTRIRERRPLTVREQIVLPLSMSLPAILAQLSNVIMQYIDAGMVGSLGADASSAIGLVASSTWLFHGVCQAANAGFTVQAAQSCGAGDHRRTRSLLYASFFTCLGLSLVLGAFAAGISGRLPVWLGGSGGMLRGASSYFLIFALSLPFFQLCELCSGMLQSTGDMKSPGFWYAVMCLMDVAFNFLLIYPTRELTVLNAVVRVPGAGLGVAGASLGTALAHVVTAVILLVRVMYRSPILKVRRGEKLRMSRKDVLRAARISLPVAVESVMMTGAYVASTRIVAPLGGVALSANSFAVTVEGLCYMPGYGISAAAAALTGQCVGAGDRRMCRRMVWNSCLLGIGIMSLTAFLMYLAAPWIIGLLTPIEEIRLLAVRVLRIQCFAEPMFAASIVAAGALRGAGDTLIPGLLGFGTMWFIRLPFSMLVAARSGLIGVWVVMAVEICVRGILFLIRLADARWLDRAFHERRLASPEGGQRKDL